MSQTNTADRRAVLSSPVAWSLVDAHDRGRAVTVTGARATWLGLSQMLTAHQVIECADWANKASRNAAKAMAGGWCGATFTEGKRDRDHATSSQVAALDLDDLDSNVLASLWGNLQQQGWAYAAATTYSHTEDAPRWRVAVLLDRPADPGEYATVVRTVAHALGVSSALDDGSTQLERLMYLPAHAPGMPHEAQRGGAAPASVDLLLAEATALGVQIGRTVKARTSRPGVVGLAVPAYRVQERLASIASEAQQALQLPDVPGATMEVQRGAETKHWGWEALVNDWAYYIAGLTVTPTMTADGATHPPMPVEDAAALFDQFVPVVMRDASVETDRGQEVLLQDKLERHLAAPVAWPLHPSDVRPEHMGLRSPGPAMDPASLVEADDGSLVPADPWEQLFTSTPTLAHIRQAAHSRLLSAPAALVWTLGRVLAETTADVELPPIVGARGSLNMGVALVGRSGDGKSSLVRMTDELLASSSIGVGSAFQPLAPVRFVGLGSGEGIAEAFMETTERTLPTGKTNAKGEPTTKVVKERRQRPIDACRVVFEKDEVGSLGAAQKRQGATLGSELRSALTGARVGQQLGDNDRSRDVQAGTYRAVVCMGVQPSRADVLLDDEDAGTPQRFVWAPLVDRSLPEVIPAWPGALDWTCPTHGRGPMLIDVPADIAQGIRQQRIDRVRLGSLVGDDNDATSHSTLTRMKVAAALALLHGGTAVTAQWWELSGIVMGQSHQVMELCQSELQRVYSKQAQARGANDAQRELARQVAVDQAAVDCAVKLARYVARRDGMETTDRDLTRHQPRVPGPTRDAAKEYAQEQGWLVRTEVERERQGRGAVTRVLWSVGDSQPA